MTPDPKRRAVIYARVSLDLRDGAGVERQELECRKLVQQRGYELVEVCIDNSLSAYSRVFWLADANGRTVLKQRFKLYTKGTQINTVFPSTTGCS